MELEIGPHTIHHGDSRDVLAAMPDNCVDAVVTDPPYALVSIVKRFGQPGAAPAKGNDAYARASAGFMGQSWDTGEVAFATEFWAQVLRVLKPGGHVVAFSGTRTYHRLAVAIEDSGFEIRDQLAWVYGSGFPKSHDVSKAIDKMFGAEREVVGFSKGRSGSVHGGGQSVGEPDPITRPATPQAQQWEGWGTALKPSHEPVVLARKPLTPDAERDISVWNLLKVRAKLWLMLSAITAESRFQLNQAERKEAFDFAQWDAEKLSSTLGDLSALTDTYQFESVLTTSLSTVTSWLNTLEGFSQLPNTSITKTTCDMTTDWKTLRFCTSQITPLSIIPEKMLQGGHNALAGTAEKYLAATFAKLNAILELSALGNAIGQDQVDSPEEDDRTHKQPIVLARKPLIGTVAANVLEHGTGAINIDGCRVGDEVRHNPSAGNKNLEGRTTVTPISAHKETEGRTAVGRFPANILHDGDQFGENGHYFYSPKASKKDRGEGNIHPTVKPTDLMAYLCRLVTPPGGVVLDPFMGSGSTGKGAHAEGFRFIGIEREENFFEIAAARLMDLT